MKLFKEKRGRYLISAGLFIFAFLYSGFFLQGIGLFEDDYTRWIRQARDDPFSRTLLQTLNPVLSDWNIQFRPFVVLVFRGLFPLFQYDASGYLYFKSLVLGIFSVFYYFFLLRYWGNKTIAFASALFLIVICATFSSLYWVSDFILVSELFGMMVYALYLSLEMHRQKPKMSRRFIFFALMLLFTLLSDRTKANGKLIPAILFFSILFSNRKRLKFYAPLLASMILILIPWGKAISHPLPGFIADKAGKAPFYSWQPASFAKFRTLLLGDFQPFSLLYGKWPPISVFSNLSYLFVYLGAAGAILVLYRFIRDKTGGYYQRILVFQRSRRGMIVTLSSVWAFVNILALASYPSAPRHFQGRYLCGVLIPLAPLVYWYSLRFLRGLWPERKRFTALLFLLAFALQIGFHPWHTFRLRNDFPTMIIASTRLRAWMDENIHNGLVVHFQLPVYHFKPEKGNNKHLSQWSTFNLTEIALKYGFRFEDCYIISCEQMKNPYLILLKEFPGRSSSLYDRIFNARGKKRYYYTLYLYNVKE